MCSCADHKFNSTKKNIVCKHICFLVCKVAKVLQPYFFETKKLSQEHTNLLISKLDKTSNIWKDYDLAKITEKPDFKNFCKGFFDDCPICFNELGDEDDVDKLVACPVCHLCLHKECIEVWLEQNKACILCKSDVWKKY